MFVSGIECTGVVLGLEKEAANYGGRIILLLGIFGGEEEAVEGRDEGNVVVFILSVLWLEYIL
jgi:hypothetical protein